MPQGVRARLLIGWLASIVAGALLVMPGNASAAVGGDTLREGEALTNEPGEMLRSRSGQYVLDWRIELLGSTFRGWSFGVHFGPTDTFRRGFYAPHDRVQRLVMQSDGNLVAYDSDGQARWASNTSTTEDVRLVVQDDGRLTVRTASDRVLWSAGGPVSQMQAGNVFTALRQEQTVLGPDGYLSSPNGLYRLVMQRDGNLVLYGPDGRALFSTRTFGGPDSVFVAQADGNLVVYDGGRAVWASGTRRPSDSETATFVAVLQNDGKFVQYLQGDPPRALWTSPTTAPACVRGAIGARWASLGGAPGSLGQPLTCELSTPHKPGRYNHFEHGSIYWSKATGAWEVHGRIRDKWAALGWENSFLGFPTTGVNLLPRGSFSRFQGGHIYAELNSGAFEVHGAIFDAWARTGWENGVLGFPLTDELPTPNKHGRYNHFEGGSVYWSPGTGAFPVENGPIRDLWASLGWENSGLGFPTSASYSVPGSSGETWTRQNFQGGVITHSPTAGTVVGMNPGSDGGGAGDSTAELLAPQQAMERHSSLSD